ncbi:hypothetical protein OEA41_004861 [Lepraria neglecta]|uniref:Dynein light chain n=1 Tax=Lepraria neglecta TaxID=209136 RepID=A0AAE0DG88_9LECA|nr:hypothetical protein OEA41_004861 [Lepraria neglecta]
MATEKKEKLEGKASLHMSPRASDADALLAQIKSADMSDEMQQQAIDVSQTAFEKFSIEKDIAQYIKKEVCRDQRFRLYAVSIQQYGS